MNNSEEIKNDMSVDRLRAWLSFVSSFRWPLVLLIFLSVFKPQLSGIIGHIDSGGSDAAWSDFPKAPAGYISSRIDALASEPDSRRRYEMAEKIHEVAARLGGIHPRSLGIFITGAGGNYHWNENLYSSQKSFFDQLESSELVTVRHSRINEDFHVYLTYTSKGIELLRAIGFEESELEDMP